MKTFTMNFIILGAICAYGAVALPAEQRLAADPGLAVANPGLAVVNPRLAADARVQNWAGQANAGQALSMAEMDMGRNIVNTLDRLMVDDSRRPGLPDRYIYDMDLQLIIDSSGSIGSSEFSRGKRAMKTLVDYVDWRCPISRYGSQVGLIEFSSPGQTHVEFSMGQYTSKWSVNNAIQNIGYDSGHSTATANALRLAKSEINQHGENGNVKVAWIVTDGQSNTGGKPKYPAKELRDMGVTVCAVAVGNYVNMVEINEIASPNCVYKAESFSRYAKIMEFASAERQGNSQGNSQEPSPVLDPDFFGGIQFS